MPNPIGWCTDTINPIVGCSHAGSPACDHCYAARIAVRLGANPATPQYRGLATMTTDGPRWTGEVRWIDGVLERALRWRKPRRIFVGSMTDLFHPAVPFEWVDRITAAAVRAPHHTWLLLTKRPERMREFFSLLGGFATPPIPNLWIGVTAEDQQRVDERIPILLDIPAARRFVSMEPMRGPVDLGPHLYSTYDRAAHDAQMRAGLDRTDRLHWVICGGETGPGARPMHPDWARSLRDQCDAAGVPFYFKGHGACGAEAMNSGFPDLAPGADCSSCVHLDFYIHGSECLLGECSYMPLPAPPEAADADDDHG